jgi:hypothetical protein
MLKAPRPAARSEAQAARTQKSSDRASGSNDTKTLDTAFEMQPGRTD